MMRAFYRVIPYSAPVAELVDARDSKSRSFWECRFDSDRGHHSFFAIVSYAADAAAFTGA